MERLSGTLNRGRFIVRYSKKLRFKAYMSVVSAGTALLTVAVVASVWYESGLGKVKEGVIPEQASASTSNTSLVVAHQTQASPAIVAGALPDIKSLAVRCQTVQDASPAKKRLTLACSSANTVQMTSRLNRFRWGSLTSCLFSHGEWVYARHA